MNALPPTDVSLYELALSADHPPSPLMVSPTVFKSIVSSVFDHLLETGSMLATEPATSIWLKLPRGEAWQSELHRYLASRSATELVYVLRNQRELELGDVDADSTGGDPEITGGDPEITGGDRDAIQVETATLGHEHAESTTLDGAAMAPLPFVELPIADESQLRREYFVLVLSPGFCLLVLAHRPKTMRSSDDSGMKRFQRLAAAPLTADNSERKQLLFGLCSFDPQTIAPVLNGIKQAIALGYAQAEANAEADGLLTNWDQMMARWAGASLDPSQVGRFLHRQVQRQEKIWHASAVVRKQADTASIVQLENEELLNQLRLKNEFLKTVGQEMRTPLANMKTALSLVNSSSLKPSQRQRYMNLLKQECDRQGALIASVLDLIQMEDVDEQETIQPLRLADVVPGVVSTYQPVAQEKGITLSCTVPADLPAVSCLGAWMRQIVINLLHNAIKFTPRGGQVRVRARLQGDYVQLEFRDTGVGIASSDIPKIFNRFYRVRHSTQTDISGVGLGLSIVQQLLLRCGGSVSVVSKVGEGSAFSVLLPVYSQTN